MDLKKIWKKLKSPLALLLAITLFFNGWTNYDFSVFAADDDLNITLSSSSAVYTGGDLTPTIVSVTDAKEENKTYAADSYQAVWSKGETPVTEIKDVGNYKVTVTVTETVPADEEAGTEETTVTKTGSKEFKVTQLNLASCTVEVNGEYTYTGEAIEPAKEKVSVSNGDVKVASELYTVDFGSKANVDAGDYGITVTAVEGNSNVTGSASGTYHIARKKIGADDVTLSAKEGIYNKEEKNQKPEVTVVVGGKTLELNSDYSVTYSDEQMNQVKTYTITVEGMKNYTGKETKTYTISYGTEGTLNYNGQTLDDSVYAGTVTVTASDAKLSTDPKGEFTDSITFTEDSVIPKNVYVLTKNNNVNEVALKTLSFDNAAPTLTVTEPDNKTWNSAKEISVTASDGDDNKNLVGVYYKDTEISISDTITKIPEGLTKLEGNTLSIEENIEVEVEKVYYFYAIDKAGHVSKAKATVKKVDVEKPVITIKSGEVASYDKDQGVFWKNADPLTIPFEVTDNLSGIKSIKVTKEGKDEEEEITDGISANRLSAEISYEVTSAGTYTITVTDEAGNEETSTFIVKQDNQAPEVALSDPTCTDRNNRYKDTEKNVWWFSENTVKIPFTVIDECGEGEEKSPYKVFFATDKDDFTDEDEITKKISADQGTVEINLTPGTHTYYFKVTDKAGNEKKAQEITIGYDDTKPVINEAIMTQLNGDEWINKAEFGGKTGVEFSVKVSDTETGISQISYSHDGGESWTDLTYDKAKEGNDGYYTFVTKEKPGDGKNYQWQIKVTNNVNKESEVQPFVKDVDGEPVYLGQIDTKAPSETAYIRFISDTEGANVEFEEENSGWTSKIWDMAKHSWNKIWGKREVKFEVYVHDETSGINEYKIQMSYDGKEIALTPENGIEAFLTGDDQEIKGIGYKVFSGSITCSENETLAIKEFAIDILEDVAGNSTTDKIILKGTDAENIIYLDSVNPELVSVKITDENDANSETAVEDKKYYYGKTKYAVVTIKEHFFGQEDTPVYPELVVSRKTTSGENTKTKFAEVKNLSTSTWVNVADDLWSATVELPSEADTEYEYQLTIEGYKDGADNPLTGINVENGNFTSKIFVIDTLAPEITGYTVEKTTDCVVDGAEVRKNVEAADLKVSFKIDDNADYYKESSGNLLVSLYKDQETEPVATWNAETLASETLVSETNGREHSYSFSYDGEEDTENKFHVEISYADQAGNGLICAESTSLTQKSTETTGTCVSGEYIIDHVTPKLTVTYSDATNVVNDQGKNDKGNSPLKDYTAYYNKAVDVTLTFDEKFVNVDAEKRNALEHFKITMTKDGAAAELPVLNWNHEDRIHTATFTLEANADHNNDGDYQFTVTYRDCAENQMDASASENSNEATASENSNETAGEVGVYTSPKLVIDTTAPEIKASYVDSEGEKVDAVNQKDSRDYLNTTDVSLKIEVTDRNIRYQELVDVLKDFEAKDIDGDGITDTSFGSDLGEIKGTTIKHEVGTNKAEPWVTLLSLSTEANYTIPLNFTDLAGNSAVEENIQQKVTVDVTPVNENIYLRFESDVKGANDSNFTQNEDRWYSQILKFVSDAWNKIWGRETIYFKVYVRDEIAGVEGLEITYLADGSNVTLSSESENKNAVLSRMLETETLKNDQEKEESYIIYSGSLTLTESEAKDLCITDFKISKVWDYAKNERSEVWAANREKMPEIYLDSVNPELVSVEITDKNGANSETAVKEKKYYYSKTKYAVVTIKERFFGQEDKPVYPELVVSRRTTSGENTKTKFVEVENLSTSTWTKGSDDQWSATVELPSEADTEYEYQLTINGYKDGADNALVGKNVKDGNFESQIFVIDTLAPKITGYTVEKTTDCVVDGAEVRKNDTKEADLKVSFKMDDNAEYYEKSSGNLLVSLYKDQGTEPVATWNAETLGSETLVSETNGREHSYSFSYDGEEDTENKFHVEISYADQAGNNLIYKENLGLTQSKEKNAPCVSGEYIIDHVTPKLTVTYSEASNVVNDKGENAEGNSPLKDYTAYYNKAVDVTLEFDEKFVNVDAEKGNALEHFEITMTKDGEAAELPELTWEHDGRKHTATFTLEANADHSNDGDYQFTVTYWDCAENQMDASASEESNTAASKESNTADKKYGVYTSPKLVIDTTAPEITTSYVDAKIQQTAKVAGNMVDYLNADNPVFRIVVKDRNIRYKELKDSLDQMSATDISKKAVDTVLKENIDAIDVEKIQRVSGKEKAETWRLNLSLQTDANYKIPVYFKDLAGNEAIIQVQTPKQKYSNGKGYTEYVTKDNTVPELELSYTIEDTANYWEWGYFFAKAKMTITAHAEDVTSGVQTILFTVVDENGKETTKTEKFKQPVKDGNYSVSIPLYTNDFKGSVYAEIVDYSTNLTCQTRGHIVESSSRHSATGTAEITTITKPSRTVRGVDFYNEDVKFKLLLQDTYSGIAKWEYIGGHTLKYEKDYKSEVGADLSNKQTDREKDILYTIDETLTLDAKANNENEILVTAQYTDNAGYKLDVEQEYNIDITKPIITVEYDLNNPANGKYYKETRTATVKIRERNFDPEDVEWLITSTDGPKPEISGWSQSGSGDDTLNVCTVAFTTDSDYTFSLKFMDMAGNVADYSRVDEFTIDKTEPEVTVTYDNNSYLNEYYYDASRTATIDILEHNFDPSAIEIMVTADGGTAGIPHISGWSQNGDHNITTITFSNDAEYTFDIAGMDLALNELADYTPDHFVVDQTAPELEIFDIEDMSANNGEVRPGIRYHDTNYDSNGTVILMTGYNNGVVEMNGSRKLEANGLELKLDDFAYVQEMDDLYTMEATVYDLAGNSSEAKVMFSVNRFGSVYTYDEATEALVGENGKYYTKEEQALGITETNVDTLEFKEITVNLNGKLSTLKEGQDFTVKASGTDATWKQYQYNIKADNFKEEGTYVVTIYSEDRATNTSDNNTKGKKIEFVVDKTNPSVLISGVETNGQYKTSSQEMLIDIDDNVLVSKVSVIIDGVETVFDAAQIAELDGRISINVEAANHAQSIQIIVTDAAGNSYETEITNVRVNANVFVLFYLNKVVFYGTLGSAVVIAALLWWFLVGKKKNKKEQAQNK